MADAQGEPRTQEPTVAQLLTDLSQQTSRLVRDELRLAQVELQDKAKHAGAGVGLFSGAGILAFLGAACLVATAILALALVLPGWLSALIVAGALLAAAGVVALVGKNEVQQASPPKPERAMENVPRDVQAVKHPPKEGTTR